MSIQDIENSKQLKKEFARLGRVGISERAIFLIDDYMSKNPEHHYKEITKLIGRFHALYIACNNDYWKEIASRGFYDEMLDLPRYETPADSAEQKE